MGGRGYQGLALAKLLIEDKEEDTQVPFLRGILTRSLQKAGLSFGQAYSVATSVRQQLSDDTILTSLELHRIVYKQLKRQFGDDVADRYLRPAHALVQVQVADGEGRLTPFSVELHRRNLVTIGLTLAESSRVAAKLRRHLIREKITQISSRRISRISYDLMENMASLGPAVARRWLVWRAFVDSGRPLILVICGTTGCGKSTVATGLAHQLDIVRMQSTDLLREVMRTMLSSDQYPELHASSYDAWRELVKGDDDLVLSTGEYSVEDGYRAQSKLISVASEAVIERAIHERISLVIEGVHAHTELAAKIDSGDAVIVHVMLAIVKKRKLKDRLSGRASKAVGRRAERYLKHFDEIWQLQTHLLSEADRTNTPIIINDDRNDTVREIMRLIVDELSGYAVPGPKEVFGE